MNLYYRNLTLVLTIDYNIGIKFPWLSTATSFIRDKLVRPTLPHSVVSDLNRNDRVGALHRAWGYVFSNQIKGAYYEFGVYRGDSFRASLKAYQAFWDWQQGQLTANEAWRRKVADHYAGYEHAFYAFDTFEGMPENHEGNLVFEAGHFSCFLEEFAKRNQKDGISESSRIRYFKGLFSDIAKREQDALTGLAPAAIANIDCDLYGSARDALKIVAPKLISGSVLLMDDWNHFSARQDHGSRRALSEFLKEHTDISLEPWFAYEFVGQAFFVHLGLAMK